MQNLNWLKSSACSGGSCVEVAEDAGIVHIRDGKNRNQPQLTFSANAWAAFTAGIRLGDFGDIPAGGA